jgi:L-serine dehydratase
MPQEPSLFDILGPVMIGPSSSHTAGASRIGFIARQLLRDRPRKALVTLYNSFAKTHKGHGTDKAIIAGIIGYGSDDERIRDAFALAREQGLEWEWKFMGDMDRFHSNTARIRLTGSGGGVVDIVGVSLGGGRIKIQEMEGFSVDFSAHMYTLVVIAKDIPGSIQHISGAIGKESINIAHMHVSRKDDMANMVIELDHPFSPSSLTTIENLSWVRFARLIEPMVEDTSRYEK